jgi:hypothetical protein
MYVLLTLLIPSMYIFQQQIIRKLQFDPYPMSSHHSYSGYRTVA